ncbi:MAG: DUF512 domain-containing protein [Candidatus Latescibacteria bacterium]|nr:DUF512 domain-containing protein [Candidatus Latescibacterota bacterium]
MGQQYGEKLAVRISDWQERFRKRLGTTFVWLSDEFYLTAGFPVLPG